MGTVLASTMRKDSKWRMISEQGGELSLKHTLDTRSMKKVLHCFLNRACWLIRILHKTREPRVGTTQHYLDSKKGLSTGPFITHLNQFLYFWSTCGNQPYGIWGNNGEVIVNLLHAEGTVHLTRAQPPFNTGHTVDVFTWQAEWIFGVSHTHWA